MTSSPLFLKLFGADGLLNLARNAEEGQSNYEVAQRFAGGALSVYAGTGKLVKGKKFLSKYELKNTRTFLKYGAQSSVYDFAYTEKKYYDKRSPLDHFGMFAVGGAAGVGIGEFFTGTKYELVSLSCVGIGAGIYAAEWSMASLIKQRAYARYNDKPHGGFYSGRSQIAKGWVSGFKWALPAHNLLLGQ